MMEVVNYILLTCATLMTVATTVGLCALVTLIVKDIIRE